VTLCLYHIIHDFHVEDKDKRTKELARRIARLKFCKRVIKDLIQKSYIMFYSFAWKKKAMP